MATSDAAPSEAARWSGRLVVALATFWGFVVALVACWGIERTGIISGRAFAWVLRVLSAVATAAAFLIGSRLAARASERMLRPLAVATGVSFALGFAFLFVTFVIRPGR